MYAINRFAPLAAVTFALATTSHTEPSTVDSDPSQDQFAEWISAFKVWGFPVPPKGSTLYVTANGRNGDYQYCNLVIASPDSSTFYYGSMSTMDRPTQELIPIPNLEFIKGLTLIISEPPGAGRSGFYSLDNMLPIAIQAIAIGEIEIGFWLLEQPVRAGTGDVLDPFIVPLDASVEVRLSYFALHVALNQWCDPAVKREDVVRSVSNVFKQGLVQPSGRFAGTELADRFSDSLAGMYESAKTSPLGLTGVRRDIERLRDVILEDTFHDSNASSKYYASSPEFERLVAYGRDALPVMADYVDDSRWTRSIVSSGKMYARRFLTVGEMVKQAISEISEGNAGTIPENSTKEAVLAYYTASKSGRVLQYWHGLLNEAIEELDVIGIRPSKSYFPRVYAEFFDCYPHEAGAMYLDTALHNPDLGSGYMAYEVQQSSLTLEERTSLLAAAANSQILEHRYYALERLYALNSLALPGLVKGQYDTFPGGPMTSQMSSYLYRIGMVATTTRDEATWASLKKLYERSDKHVRYKLVRCVMYSPEPKNGTTDNSKNFDLVARLLADFIDDDSTFTAEEAELLGRPLRDMLWLTLGDVCVITIRNALARFDGSFEGEPVPGFNVEQEQMPSLRARVVKELHDKGYLKK